MQSVTSVYHLIVTPTTQDTSDLVAFIEEAREALGADNRISAAWLGGSFARGTADAWSDIDLHVAVPDGEWESVFASRHQLLSAIRPLLGFIEMSLPWGTHLVSATVSGPVRVDLFLEKLSQTGGALRREDPVLLFDRVNVEGSLHKTWPADVIIRTQLRDAVRMLFFGSSWPVRLWGREEWGTMMFNATQLIFQWLVPAMIVQDDPQSYFRPQYHNERHLNEARRRVADGFVVEIAQVFADGWPPDSSRVISLHERLIGAVWRELRLACALHGVDYPTASQEAMREYYLRELGLKVTD